MQRQKDGGSLVALRILEVALGHGELPGRTVPGRFGGGLEAGLRIVQALWHSVLRIWRMKRQVRWVQWTVALCTDVGGAFSASGGQDTVACAVRLSSGMQI